MYGRRACLLVIETRSPLVKNHSERERGTMALITHVVEGAAPRETVLDDGTRVVRTCSFTPPGCHSVGGGLRIFVKDGIIQKVEGDPDHPITHGKLCPRCLTLKDYVYNPRRILHPMKRIGDRGEDKWEEISWEQAREEIVEKITSLQDQYGKETVLYMCGTGRQATKYQFAMIAGVWGSPNMCYSQSGWSCMGPRNTVMKSLTGAGYSECNTGYGLPGWFDNPNFTLPKYTLVWGKEPTRSNPDGLWGHAIVELMKHGSKLITVDPRISWLGSRAYLNLQLRPGTDTALALALLHIVIKEDLYDHDFVDKWCYGFEEFRERIMQYTPEFAAEECDVPLEDIYKLGRILGQEKPWTLTMGVATDQNSNGTQLVQSLMALVAITGNLDAPGGTLMGEALNIDFGKDSTQQKTKISIPKEIADKAIGKGEYPMLDLLLNTTHPDLTLDALETGKPYPIKAVWLGSTNLLTATNSAQPYRWYQAFRKAEIIVAQETQMTPTVQALADYVLPLKTFVEYEGHVMTYQGQQEGIIGSQIPIVEVGDCKSDLEMAMYFGIKTNPDYWSQYPEPSDYLDEDLRRYNLKFKDLAAETVLIHEVPWYKYEKGLIRADGKPGFNTTTGLFELYALMFEAVGDDPLPYYEAPRWAPDNNPQYAKEYPLTLTTGQRNFTFFHSEYRSIKELREINPYAIAQIHPNVAAEHGIEDGDWMWIENMFGRALFKAEVTPIVRENLVAAEHGWWYPEDEADAPHLYGTWEANINQLIPHKSIGFNGFGAPYKHVCCKIYKADHTPVHDWKNLY